MTKKKILVVDAPTKSRLFLVQKLTEQGHEVTTAAFVGLSPELLKGSNFDLVIVEGSVNPAGPADDGAKWAISVCDIVPIVVFSLTKYFFTEQNIKYFNKILGYRQVLDYVDQI